MLADLECNARQRSRVVALLEKIERDKKLEEEYLSEEGDVKRHRKPTVV